MHDTQPQSAPAPRRALFITDAELAPLIGVSVGFLQRDRREGKRIPFIRLGDRCLYDPAEVLAAMKALTIGGPRGGRGGRGRRVAEAA